MNSVKLICHKYTLKRVYVQFGPTWSIPISMKALDQPWKIGNHKHYTQNTFKSLLTSVRSDNPMVFAQLNTAMKYSN